MGYINPPPRTDLVDLVSGADFNQTQDNIRALKGGNPNTAPSTTIEDLAAGKLSTALKGAPGGLAELDGAGKIPAGQLPAIAITEVIDVADQAAMLASGADVGTVAIRLDDGSRWILAVEPASTLSNWRDISHPDAVVSVNGQLGAVNLTTDDVPEGAAKYFHAHAGDHAAGGPDELTPAAIGAIPAAAAGAALGVATLDAGTKLEAAQLPGHAATHAAAGSDPLTPGDIGAVAEGDARLSDARTPTAHAASHAAAGSDPIAPADIGAAAVDDPRFSQIIGYHAFTHARGGLIFNFETLTGMWSDGVVLSVDTYPAAIKEGAGSVRVNNSYDFADPRIYKILPGNRLDGRTVSLWVYIETSGMAFKMNSNYDTYITAGKEGVGKRLFKKTDFSIGWNQMVLDWDNAPYTSGDTNAISCDFVGIEMVYKYNHPAAGWGADQFWMDKLEFSNGSDPIFPNDIGAAAYDDPRFSETPIHAARHATGGPDQISPASIGAIPASEKGAALGVAPLGADSKIDPGYLPSIAIDEVYFAASNAEMTALSLARTGDVCKRTDVARTFILANDDYSVLSHWVEVTAGGEVLTVAGRAGNVVLTTDDVSEGPTGTRKYYRKHGGEHAKNTSIIEFEDSRGWEIDVGLPFNTVSNDNAHVKNGSNAIKWVRDVSSLPNDTPSPLTYLKMRWAPGAVLGNIAPVDGQFPMAGSKIRLWVYLGPEAAAVFSDPQAQIYCGGGHDGAYGPNGGTIGQKWKSISGALSAGWNEIVFDWDTAPYQSGDVSNVFADYFWISIVYIIIDTGHAQDNFTDLWVDSLSIEGGDFVSPASIGAIDAAEKGAALGVAELDAGGTLKAAQVPANVLLDEGIHARELAFLFMGA